MELLKLVIGPAIFGFILGFLVQRSRFCMTGAIRDYILFGIDRNLKMVLIVFAICTFAFTLILTISPPGIDRPLGPGTFGPTMQPAGWFSIVGGIIFGIGMAIAGGCVTSTYSRIGEGSINYLITGICMPLGIIMGSFVWKPLVLPIGQKTTFMPGTSLETAYGLIWVAPFPSMPSLGNALLDIPPIFIGIPLAAIYLFWYYKLESAA